MDKTTTAEIRLSFSQIVPKLQLAWDSTSLNSLKRCPRYYQYNIVEGYVSRLENVHLRFGSEYNNALVIYDKARAAGAEHDDAVLAAIRYALTATWDETLGRPWASDLPVKTRETLIRSIVWYFDKFADDPFVTQRLGDDVAAVEVPFRFYIDEDATLTGEPYLLCGYLDKLVNWSGSGWIVDKKTTKSPLDEKYFNEYTPNTQVSQYSFAGHVIGGEHIKGVIIDAVQLGVTFSRFQRSQITRTPSQLEEWLKDSLTFIRQNEQYVKANYWPQNDAVCGLYGGCPYRAICSKSPDVRQPHLNALYAKRKWDPLVTREI